MKFFAFTLASLLGLSTPMVTNWVLLSSTAVAMPTDFVRPEGYFQDDHG